MTQILTGERIGRRGRIRLGCSAAVFDPGGEKLLLTRRTDNGQWCLPGGGVDPGESVVETIVREMREETGLDVTVTRLIGVYSDPDYLIRYIDGNQFHIVALHFEAAVTGGQMGLSDETTEIGYFSPQEIADLDLMVHHRVRIEDTLAGRQTTFLR